MHRDARSDAATLRRHCAELKAAADSAQDAHAAQLESVAAQWEFRLSQRESELLAAQQLLQGQLTATRVQMHAVEGEAKEAREAVRRESEGQSGLRAELQDALERVRAAEAASEEANAAAGHRDDEVQTLHGQVRPSSLRSCHAFCKERLRVCPDALQTESDGCCMRKGVGRRAVERCHRSE